MHFLAALVALVVIGTHAESGSVTPLLAVEIGDTSRSEALSTQWMPYFGANAVNGVVYTPRGEGAYNKTTFIRPSNTDQAVTFHADRDLFTSTEVVPVPALLASLGANVEHVSYVVVYFDGGAKVYLKSDTQRKDAEAIAASLENR